MTRLATPAAQAVIAPRQIALALVVSSVRRRLDLAGVDCPKTRLARQARHAAARSQLLEGARSPFVPRAPVDDGVAHFGQ